MKKIWVNGSFDVLHIGHIRLLEYASNYGNVTVGVDTDERIKEYKGEMRPFNSLQDRIDFLLSIKYVTSVVSFGTNDELIERISSTFISDCIKRFQSHYFSIIINFIKF